MKGIGFVNVRRFVLEKHGEEALAKVMARLSVSDRSELASAVAVGWYPVAMFGRMLRAVDAVCGRGDLKLARALGAYAAECDFHRALRTFIRVLSPDYLFKMHQRLWQHFQSAGRWESTRDGPHEATLTLHDYVVDEAVCIELAGYCARMVEFTGATDVTFEHPSCRARGGATCTFRVRWR